MADLDDLVGDVATAATARKSLFSTPWKGLGRMGKFGRVAGGVGGALLLLEGLGLAKDALWGNERAGKLNRANQMVGELDEDLESSRGGDDEFMGRELKSITQMERNTARNRQTFESARDREVQEMLAPIQGQMAANAYKEQPSLAEILSMMGYGGE